MLIYKNVLQLLKEAGYNTTTIMRDRLLSQATLDALRHNRPVNTKTIETICKLTKCQPGDFLMYVEDKDTTDE